MKSRFLIFFFFIFALSILAYKMVNHNFRPGKKEISSAPANGTTEIDLGDNVRMHFVPISKGCFKMGRADEDIPIKVFDDSGSFQLSGYEIWDEAPERNVAIGSDFYMGKYEVTQEQYQKIMGKNSSVFESKDGFFFSYDASQQPVDEVRWYDAISFCNNLSANQGLEPCYTNSAGSSKIEIGDKVLCNWEANGYRLPTEAEWEYCCKAGTNTRFSWGNAEDEATAKQNAWYQKNADKESWTVPHAERHGPQPVGKLKPNPWGICDMHGNVGEWCWDWYGQNYYQEYENTDPRGPGSGTSRVVRGFGWYDRLLAPVFRGYREPDSYGQGFRVLRLQNPGAKGLLINSEGESNACSERSATPIEAATGTTEIEIGSGVKMNFVHISSGSFQIFQTDKTTGRKTTDTVSISKGFLLGKYEVTQEQYKSLMGKNPSNFTPVNSYPDTSKQPVETVTWFDAVSFCNKLSINQGLKPCYRDAGGSPIININEKVFCDWQANGYRLPTRAEWEYSCRAGTITEYSWGDGGDDRTINEYAWCFYNVVGAIGEKPLAEKVGTQPVGTKNPNPWGVYDMHGNVSEWCWDWHDKENNTRGGRDPLGPVTGSDRIICGGNWNDGTYWQKSNKISANKPFLTSNGFGFRVLRVTSKLLM